MRYDYDLCLLLESWSSKVDNESGFNIEIVLSDHEKQHESQFCVKIHDQTNEVEESNIYKERCEKEDVVCEETMIVCEYKENEGVKVSELVEQ